MGLPGAGSHISLCSPPRARQPVAVQRAIKAPLRRGRRVADAAKERRRAGTALGTFAAQRTPIPSTHEVYASEYRAKTSRQAASLRSNDQLALAGLVDGSLCTGKPSACVCRA